MSAARTEKINRLRDKGYSIVEITVPKDRDESNRPSAIMLNPQNEEYVLVKHTGEVVPLSGAAAVRWEKGFVDLGDKV